MTTRRFEFSEGTSNKFWTITLDGKCHSVRYGRIGTIGQTQTADFASEAEALKSFNKLVAEKLKKGYVEKSAEGETPVAATAVKKAAAPPASKAPSQPLSEAPPRAAAATAAASPAPAPAIAGNVRRDIELDPIALSYIPSRRRLPAPTTAARPFDLQDCLDRMRTKLRISGYGWSWDFARAIPEGPISREEAEFWLRVMTTEHRHTTDGPAPETIADLTNRTYQGEVPSRLNLESRYIDAHVVKCLATLMSADELRSLLVDPSTAQGAQAWSHQSHVLREGFRRFVLPYLDDAEVAKWQNALRALWPAASWPTGNFYQAPAPAFFYGAMFGLHDEVRALVEQWPDDLYIDPSWDHTHYHRPQEVVVGAGSPEQVADQFRRLKLPTNSALNIQTFLAVTQFVAIDVVARTIANTTKKEEADELSEAFACIHAPDAAPHALHLTFNSKAPKAARDWLENNLDEAIVGLIPIVGGSGKLADAATEFLNSVKRRGQAERIATHLAGFDAEVAARVRAEVLDVIEVQLPELSRDATPAWWTQALAQSPVKKAKNSLVQLSDLPAIAIGEHALGAEHIGELLSALQASTLEKPHPLLSALRTHATPDRLDAFGWKLFESWLGNGAPPKDKWAFIASGFLGGDRTVLKLAPLVREWPGESQHQRAVLGLEVLRTIGTDTALMQINGIAQKVKFKGLKERAVECMDAIAESRGMSRAQLEDRIVPDCGLDERGERTFDFGSRQFRFVLGPELKAMIRYPDGATKSDLPKPNSKDDADTANAAVAEWKLLKKQIADVAKIQAVRLEQAMVTGRRWSGDEVDKLIVRHPLMIHLARLLVWALHESGKVVATFRVAEDRTLADAADAPFTLAPDANVGVLHPLQLAEQPHVLEQWGQIFGDYEIVPPFAQLGRPTYRLSNEERDRKEITQFATRGKLPAQTLVFGLEKLGWQRGVPADAGWVGEHSKQFYGAGMTAVVGYEEGFSVGYWEGAGEQTIQRIFFLPGLYTPQMYPDHKNALRLADVDPIALSEVLGDFELLLAKVQ